MRYKAFISYSHAADAKLAPALQAALQGFAKPWYRLNTMRIFRDQSSLSASPQLWSAIVSALNDTEYFLLMAGPESAESIWVGREVEWWIQNRKPDTILIVLTGGEFGNWRNSVVLPTLLHEHLTEEPLYVDLRWARTDDELSVRNVKFRDAVLDLAAPLLGRPKDDLDGEDVRQHRRTRRIAWAAVMILLAFAIVAGREAVLARKEARIAESRRMEADQQRQLALTRQKEAELQKNIAEERTNAATARGLALQAHLVLYNQPALLERSLLLAAEGLRRLPSPEADEVTREGISLLPPSVRSLVHKAGVSAIAISPDGTRLVTGGADGAAYLWTIPDGRQIATLPHRTTPAPLPEPYRKIPAYVDMAKVLPIVNLVAFSPDGRLIATGCEDFVAFDGPTAKVWDGKTGRLIKNLEHKGPLRSLAFSPDSTMLVTGVGEYQGESEKGVRIWSVPDGKVLSTLPLPEAVRSVAISPDGKLLAATGDGQTARLFEMSGKEIKSFKSDRRGSLYSVAFSLDGKLLATGSSDKTASIWDIATGKERATLQHDAEVGLVLFSPDGKMLASVSKNSIFVWDAVEGREMFLLRHANEVHSAVFSPDSRYLGSASLDFTGRVWEMKTGTEITRIPHTWSVNGIAFSKDGALIATAGGDNVAKIWKRHDPEYVRIPADTTARIVYSPDGKRLASGGWDFNAYVWDALTGRQMAALKQPNMPGAHLVYSADGKYLATANYENIVQIWDTASNALVGKLKLPGPVTSIAFHPKRSSELAVGSLGKAVTLWDAPHARMLATLTHPSDVLRIAFNHEGSRLIATTQDGGLHYWDVEQKRRLAIASHPDLAKVLALAFTDQDRQVIAVTQAGTVLRWREGETQVSPIVKHQILACSFDRDGRLMALVKDETAIIYDLPQGQERARVAHDNQITGIELSPSGRLLATAGYDNNIRIWDASNGKGLGLMKHAGFVHSFAFSPDERFIAMSTGSLDSGGGSTWLSLLQPADLLADACRHLERNLSPGEWTTFVGNEPYRKTCPDLP